MDRIDADDAFAKDDFFVNATRAISSIHENHLQALRS